MTKKYYKYKETHRKVKGVQQKLCTKCIKWKGESEFRRERATKDGLSRLCRECGRSRERAIYRKDKKHVRERLTYEENHRTVHGVKQKLCCGCKQWKKGSLFHINRRSKDGLQWQCKECARKRREGIRKAGRRNLRYEDRHRVVKGVKQKFCRKCKRWRNESEFYKDRSVKDGLDNRCKECSYKPTGKPRHRIVNGIREKLCNKCREWKKESDFYKDKGAKDGLTGRCKKCSYKTTSKSHGRKRKGVRRNLRYEERHRTVNGAREKLCTKCGRWKMESDFHKNNSRKDGLTYQCRKCSHKAYVTSKSRKK